MNKCGRCGKPTRFRAEIERHKKDGSEMYETAYFCSERCAKEFMEDENNYIYRMKLEEILWSVS